jgi:hypothetical protein
MSTYSKDTIDAIRAALSPARMATFEAAVTMASDDDPAALELYTWNAAISGALFPPLHICEVVIRNAVSDALEIIYGSCWPWSTVFERSLPNPSKGYSPRADLINARRHTSETEEVIPELNFVF